MNARLVLLCLFACSRSGNVSFDPRAIHPAGQGAFTTELTGGERGPSNRKGMSVRPKVTADFKGPPATNEWWSSLIWQFDDDPHSRPMFPHPLALKAEAEGLGIGYPTEPTITPREYRYPYQRDIRLSVTGLKAPDTRVESYSDWAVTASWGPELRATFGHGLPYVYAHVKGEAKIEIGDAKIWGEDGAVLGLTVRGRSYGVFAPSGAKWRKEGASLLSDLAGKGFVSIAVLPDAEPATLELYRKHAYAFVTGTDVTWSFDPKASRITSRYEVKTSLMEDGHSDLPLLALYPHQWKATKTPLLAQSYASPRGKMKLAEARSFEVERTFHGVMPALPDAGARGDLQSLVREAAGASDLFPPGLEGKKDSYWTGKSLGKVATLVWLADQIGDTDTSAKLVSALAKELADWFDGKPPHAFYYDETWRTLIGLPTGYQSGTELNDHHFHYGYFVYAAATVLAHDPGWRQHDMVDLLIRDVASLDRSDTRFPRLRYFDPYAGHSWASGPAMFDRGNNEESSSEDVSFASALVLWGSIKGDTALRDLGIYLYETTVSAIEQYWLDVDHDVFPKGFSHPVVGIVWGDGGNYDTWWDRNPVYVHGINVLPVTGASLYLGRRPDTVRSNYEHLLKEGRGSVNQWREVMWMYLALADAPRAAGFWDKEHYFEPEFGSSMAAAYHWIQNLQKLGHVDTTVTADTASYAAFRSGARAAFNPGPAPLKVTFTDGTVLEVPPRAMRTTNR